MTSSVDDIVWLLPFLADVRRDRRILSAILYIATLECVVFLSWVIAVAGRHAAGILLGPGGGYWLQIAAAALLAVYAAYLWVRSRHDTVSAPTGAIVVVAFLGSLDELSTFPAFQWSGLFTAVELALGTLLAAAFIVLVCLGAARVQPLTAWLRRVPLWLVMAVVAALALGQAVI